MGPITETVEGQSQQWVEESPGALQPQLGVPDHGAAAVGDRADAGLVADRDALGLGGEDDVGGRLDRHGHVGEAEPAAEEADLELVAGANRPGLPGGEPDVLDARIPFGDRAEVGEVAPDLRLPGEGEVTVPLYRAISFSFLVGG